MRGACSDITGEPEPELAGLPGEEVLMATMPTVSKIRVEVTVACQGALFSFSFFFFFE